MLSSSRQWCPFKFQWSGLFPPIFKWSHRQKNLNSKSLDGCHYMLTEPRIQFKSYYLMIFQKNSFTACPEAGLQSPFARHYLWSDTYTQRRSILRSMYIGPEGLCIGIQKSHRQLYFEEIHAARHFHLWDCLLRHLRPHTAIIWKMIWLES